MRTLAHELTTGLRCCSVSDLSPTRALSPLLEQLGTHKRAKAKRELCQNLLRAAARRK